MIPDQRQVARRHIGQDQPEHALDVGARADREHGVELLAGARLLRGGALAAHPVDADRPPAERPPQERLGHLDREDAPRGQRLGHGGEQPERHAHAVGRRRDRVAQRLRHLRPHDRHRGEQHRQAGDEPDAEADRRASRAVAVIGAEEQRHQHADGPDQAEEQHPQRAAERVGGDEAAGRDVDDALGHEVGTVDAVDQPGHPLVQGADEALAARRRHTGRLLARRLPRRARAGGEAQDVGAHLLGALRGEVFETHVRVGAGAHHLELRHADQPGGEGPGEVHALHPVERRAPVGAEHEPLAHLHVVARDPELVEAPQHPEDRDQDEHRREEDAEAQQHHVVGEQEVDHVDVAVLDGVVLELAGREDRHEPHDRVIAEARQDDAAHDDQHEPALEQRRERVHAVPDAVGERRRPAVGQRGGGAGRGSRLRRGERVGHSPVRRVSATSMSVSRSASEASRLRPGISTPVVAAAVTILSLAIPKARSMGPWVMSTSCRRP